MNMETIRIDAEEGKEIIQKVLTIAKQSTEMNKLVEKLAKENEELKIAVKSRDDVLKEHQIITKDRPIEEILVDYQYPIELEGSC